MPAGKTIWIGLPHVHYPDLLTDLPSSSWATGGVNVPHEYQPCASMYFYPPSDSLTGINSTPA